jgi:thiamine biosynthesis lipoprotein ApbE
VVVQCRRGLEVGPLQRVEVQVKDALRRDASAAEVLSSQFQQSRLARAAQSGEDLDDWSVDEPDDSLEVVGAVYEVQDSSRGRLAITVATLPRFGHRGDYSRHAGPRWSIWRL